MTPRDFEEKIYPPLCHTSSHFPGPPSKMTSQTSNLPPGNL